MPEKLFLYETKRVFDIHYVNTKPAHALFLDTKFKTKYICDTELSFEERRKVKNSLTLKEYNREYKRMHGLHYNHQKKIQRKEV